LQDGAQAPISLVHTPASTASSIVAVPAYNDHHA